MIKTIAILKKEDGSVIIAALLILVLLTIIGISATSTSNMELNITSNAQLHKMSFFMAESGWHVMADWLDDQYPMPTLNLASRTEPDNHDNDDDGTIDEIDEQMDFTESQYDKGFVEGSDGIDNDGDGDIDELHEQYGLITFSANSPNYKYGVRSEFVGAGIAAGWDPTKFLRYDYQITSIGNVSARRGDAVAVITVNAGKIQEK